MRASAQVFSAAAIVGMAAAVPAPQAIALGEIFAAPPVTLTGPPLDAVTQTVVVETADIMASISAEVTTVATAAITGAAASNAANINPPTKQKREAAPAPVVKRAVEKRDLLSNLLALLGARYNTANNAAAAATSSTSAAAAAAVASTTAAQAAPTVANKAATTSSSSSSSSSSAAPSTTSASSTLNTLSGTSTTSSTTACPTTPEDGTYCGFINPEDPCAPQPDGYGPNVTVPNDTPDAFMAYAPFQVMAQAALTPGGYANTFKNMNASTSANSYMGLYTLNKYDPSICAAYCDQTTSCTSFNIYIERDPSLNPCKNDSTDPTVWGYWCPQPSSITNYKCTLWGSNIDASTAVNQGGWRRDFNVVITGSNGYDKTNNTTPVLVLPVDTDSSSSTTAAAAAATSTTAAASTVVPITKGAGVVVPASSSTSSVAVSAPTAVPNPDYAPAQNCSGKAINAGNYWLGSKFINGPFDPSLCAAYASATTQANKKAAQQAGKSRYTPCQMFNAYHVYKGSQPMGTYCALYNAQLSTSWATVQGSYSGRDYYAVRNSWTFSLKNQDSGRC